VNRIRVPHFAIAELQEEALYSIPLETINSQMMNRRKGFKSYRAVAVRHRRIRRHDHIASRRHVRTKVYYVTKMRYERIKNKAKVLATFKLRLSVTLSY